MERANFVLAFLLETCNLHTPIHSGASSCFVAGLAKCHAVGIAHRDIKPENILITPRPEELTRPEVQLALCQCPQDEPHDIVPDTLGVCFKCLKARLTSALGASKSASASTAVGNGRSTSATGSTGMGLSLSINTSIQQGPDTRRQYLAKVCDFGAAFCGDTPSTPRSGQAPQVAKSPCGSAYYCAPEIARLMKFDTSPGDAEHVWGVNRAIWAAIREKGYDPFPTDVWSLGMMLFTLCSGLKPFHSACVSDAMFRAFVLATQPEARHHELCAPDSPLWQSASSDRAWRWPKRLSPQLVALMGACLRVEPSERISMHDVCTHIWFAAEGPSVRSSPPTEDLSAISHGAGSDTHHAPQGMPHHAPGTNSSHSQTDITQHSDAHGRGSAAGAEGGAHHGPTAAQLAALQQGSGSSGGAASQISDVLSVATSHRSFQGKRMRARSSGARRGGMASNSMSRSGSNLSGGGWSDTSSIGGASQYSANAALSRLSDLTDEAPLFRGKRAALPPVVESPHANAAAMGSGRIGGAGGVHAAQGAPAAVANGFSMTIRPMGLVAQGADGQHANAGGLHLPSLS